MISIVTSWFLRVFRREMLGKAKKDAHERPTSSLASFVSSARARLVFRRRGWKPLNSRLFTAKYGRAGALDAFACAKLAGRVPSKEQPRNREADRYPPITSLEPPKS